MSFPDPAIYFVHGAREVRIVLQDGTAKLENSQRPATHGFLPFASATVAAGAGARSVMTSSCAVSLVFMSAFCFECEGLIGTQRSLGCSCAPRDKRDSILSWFYVEAFHVD